MSFRKTLRKAFIGGDWYVCYKKKDSSSYILISNPPKKWIADPFIYEHDGKLLILGEFYSKSKELGEIYCGLIEGDRIVNHTLLIETKTHMSYPFIFNFNQKMYLMPENSQAGRLALYQIDLNTLEVSYLHDILINTDLVDCSILQLKDNIYVIGYSERKKQLASFLLDSNLYCHSDFFWFPEDHTSRPAGRAIIRNHMLLQPFQNNSKKYGESIIIKEVILDKGYINFLTKSEILATDITFSNFVKIPNKVHTINMTDNYVIFDVFFEKIDPFRWVKMLRRLAHKKRKIT